jgi:hypothetical protein
MTTLENLYNGNINPSDLDGLKYKPEYSRALNRVCAARQKLTDSLSAEQRELLERYISSSPSLYLEYKKDRTPIWSPVLLYARVRYSFPLSLTVYGGC